MSFQSDAIRDYVFPVVIARKVDGGFRYESFLGSAFLIGSNGFALTASHVVKSNEADLAAMFVSPANEWLAFPIEVVEHHPEQDAALLRLTQGTWKSIFSVSAERVNASLEYQLFGYPTDALHEDLCNKDQSGRVPARPDLIFSKGHVRRRISWNPGIPGVKGDAFLELSTVAGEGCSGSPVFQVVPGHHWKVVGLYVGEKINDRATSVSYAVRLEAINGWAPARLGRSIQEESRDA